MAPRRWMTLSLPPSLSAIRARRMYAVLHKLREHWEGGGSGGRGGGGEEAARRQKWWAHSHMSILRIALQSGQPPVSIPAP